MKSVWKPADQPTWRGGAATIWEKPAVVNAGQLRPLVSAIRNRSSFIEDEDPYQGWSSPLELQNQSKAECPRNDLSATRNAPAENNGDIPTNWFESSDDEEMLGAIAIADVEAPAMAPGMQTMRPPQAHHPMQPEQGHHHQELSHENHDASNPGGIKAGGDDIYEDWYYEKRPMLRGTPVQDLASCSTTTGGIQVCRNAAQHWVYPAHIPERKYQLHAISRALFSNTLVCYPTGLGKTLIAAVVMHNFFRWFPMSKVVFIAPTKPLVAQQMKACQKFMGIDESKISEMTGKASGESRKAAWNSREVRVYFCTPQTFWNDVKRGICPYDLVSCIVVDECHRATGQADIVKAIKDMRNAKNCKFRLLGLSATPGSSHEQVQEVIDSLGISTLVFKDETDKDVAPYVHNKRSEVVIVNPECAGNASRSMLMATLQRIVGDLSSKGHYFGVADAERVTRFGMQHARKNCKKATWAVTGQFIQAQVLADVRDQLDGYGARTALSFLQAKMVQEKHMKSLHSSDPQFAHFVSSLQKAQGSNPKLEKLKEILDDFFSSGPEWAHAGTSMVAGRPVAIRRAIIFASLRDGVASIVDALQSMSPLVRAKMFIGQGGGKGQTGMKQSEQKQVLADFSSGTCNLLVATCIGEEGLDIPNVDLIVCFDAISSPTRALQRQGRTGRHGDGRVIYLLTAGQEEDRFNKSASAMKKLHAQLKDAEQFFTLNENVVRMLPREFGIPKMAHLVEDVDTTEMSCGQTDITAAKDAAENAGEATAAAGTPFTSRQAAQTGEPYTVPHIAPHPDPLVIAPRFETPARHLTVIDLVGAEDSVQAGDKPHSTILPQAHVDLRADPEVVEEMPLMQRLELMKAHTRTKGKQLNAGGDARRRWQIISSQSTPSDGRPPTGRSPQIGSPGMGATSSISLENLSVKKTTPQQLSRLCRAGDQKSVASKVNRKRRSHIGGNGDIGWQGKPANKNKPSKPLQYLDEEASISGDDSGDEGEDLVENPSLQAFFDDATQDGSPAVHGLLGHPFGTEEESPGVMDLLARVRSKRQQRHTMLDTQSQEFSRATPNEYDLDDSFLADSDDIC